MKYKLLLAITVLLLGISSCELDLSDDMSTSKVVQGLKAALEIGTDTATSKLAVIDGYYKGDPLNVKIPLPPDAEQVRNILEKTAHLGSLFNLDAQFEKVVKSVNRAAEEAAKDAGVIFFDEIRALSITDAMDILNGHNPLHQSLDFDPTAATGYFFESANTELTNLYAPKINTALDSDLGLGFSANDAWQALATEYNRLMGDSNISLAINLAGVDMPSSLEEDIGPFCTEKALGGLRYMVGKEEMKIREDPYQWSSTLIQDVFGSVMEQ
ncbi:MAG: DUF4197 domain-containing protein [Bacteroidales bacterium]|nr:DUF4197 domain-containing protein [Bacteroidales bacterium]